jgi:hypothetical protein
VYEEKAVSFYEKWGVLPPMTVDLLDENESLQGQRGAHILGTGTWGLIPVFPWTTQDEVKEALKRIQRKIPRGHTDTKEQRRRAQIASWLGTHTDAKGRPIPRTEIARVVWSRKSGLRRPSKAQAIARLPEDRETKWLSDFIAQGIPRGEAGRRVYRRARGAEAKASSQVRTALARYGRGLQTSLAFLGQPKECDPAAFALTKALRAAFQENAPNLTRQWLERFFESLTSSPDSVTQK